MFFPGETICHKFHIPFIKTDINKIIATYRQDGQLILERPIETEEIEDDNGGSVAIIRFTQQESLCFQNCTSFLVQLNVILTDGTRCTSKPIKGMNGAQHVRKVVTSDG